MISVSINVDLSGISEQAIRNALAARIEQLRREAQQKIEREAQQAKVTKLEAIRTDKKGIEDLPTWNPNPPRLELSAYKIKNKHWNMIWVRYDIFESQGRFRLYISNSSGTGFKELNLDWALDYLGHSLAGNATTSEEERPDPDSFMESILPAWVKKEHLIRLDDLAPWTAFEDRPDLLAGNTYYGYLKPLSLQRWLYNPKFSGLSLTNTGPFALIHRCVFSRLRAYGGVRIALLPLIDDICVVAVMTRTIVRQRTIDYFRRITGGGSISASNGGLTKSFDVPAPFYFAQKINGVEQVPVHEFLVGRVHAGFGQIKSITVCMAPGNPGGPSTASFDQTQLIKFKLMKSKNMPSHYRKYYADYDNVTGCAKPGNYDGMKPEDIPEREWAPGTDVSPELEIGTDPVRFAPDKPGTVYPLTPCGYTPQGQNDPICGTPNDCSDSRGWNPNDYYTENNFNLITGAYEGAQRIYRSWTWGYTSDTNVYGSSCYLNNMGLDGVEFGTLEEGDYLWVRITDVRYGDEGNTGPPFVNEIHGTVRHTPWLGYREEGVDAAGRPLYGGYEYPQLHGQRLWMTITTQGASTQDDPLPGFTTSNFKEEAFVMEDQTTDNIHDEETGIEPVIRTFVLSDAKIEEIQPPSGLFDSMGDLFGVNTPSTTSAKTIYEGASGGQVNWGSGADPMQTGTHGPTPGRNLISFSEDFTFWSKPTASDSPGFIFTPGYGSPPVASEFEDAKTSYVFFPAPSRENDNLSTENFSYIVSPLLQGLDYRTNNVLIGKKYTFSIYVSPVTTGARDGGILEPDVSTGDCSNDDEYNGVITLMHVVESYGELSIQEYRSIKLDAGWNRVQLDLTLLGNDYIRIDNWNGEMLEDLGVEIFGAQLEPSNGEGKPGEYQSRGRFFQVYRSGVLSDVSAKGNATQTIGSEPPGFYLGGGNYNASALGLGMEGQSNAGGSNLVDPLTIGKFSPMIYSQMGVMEEREDGGARTKYGAPWYNVGPYYDKENGTYQDPTQEDNTYWQNVRALINEKVSGGIIDPGTQGNYYPGKNGADGKVRASGDTYEGTVSSGQSGGFGNLSRSSSEESGEKNTANSGCSRSYGYGGGYGGGGGSGGGAGGGDGNGNGGGEDEEDRQSCEFKVDKNKRLKSWLNSCRFQMAELLWRGRTSGHPYIYQYTSWGNLEDNAQSLENLGFDPEIILGVATPGS